MSVDTVNTVTAGGSLATWAEHARRARERLRPIETQLPRHRLAFITETPGDAIEVTALAASSGLDFSIIARDRFTPELASVLAQNGIASVEGGVMRGGGAPPESNRVGVFTSGTTGVPKLVEHSWRTLNTMAAIRNDTERWWFVPYQPGSYAWLQMICLGLFTPGQHLVMAEPEDPVSSFEQALKTRLTAISSTPTFWRFALLKIDEDVLRRSALESITLGGEIVDQELLDQLREILPHATVRHIYASSEAGAAIVVSDGLAGFPVEKLHNNSSPIQLKIESGRLHVRSAFTTASSVGDQSQWVDTGDLVEVRGNRVHFLGRESGLINVGGLKVMPAEVEDCLLSHPDVLWAQVRGRKAPVVGEVPSAQVVLRQSGNPQADEARLIEYVSAHLPPHAIPRAWKFPSAIPLDAGQKSRQ